MTTNIPETIFKELSRKGSLIVKDGDVYIISDSKGDGKLRYSGGTIKLNKVGTTQDLENLYFKIKGQKLQSIKDEYIGNSILGEISKCAQKEIIHKIFPFFYDGQKESFYDNLTEKLNQSFNMELEPEDVKYYIELDAYKWSEDTMKKLGSKRTSVKKRRGSILGESIKEDIITIGDGVFSLEEGEGQIQIEIGDKPYRAGKFIGTSYDINKKYKDSLSKLIDQEAKEELEIVEKFIDESGDSDRILKMTQALNSIEEFSLGDVSVLKKNGVVYACLDVPQHILVDSEDEYWKFNNCKIGMRVSVKNSELSFNQPCYILDGKYPHPFVNNSQFSGDPSICMGTGYKFDDRSSGMNTSSSLYMFLSNARDILLRGFHGDVKMSEIDHVSYTNYIENGDIVKISKEEALSSGIPITNKNVKKKK